MMITINWDFLFTKVNSLFSLDLHFPQLLIYPSCEKLRCRLAYSQKKCHWPTWRLDIYGLRISIDKTLYPRYQNLSFFSISIYFLFYYTLKK